MTDAYFVGFKDFGWGKRTPPLILFKTLEDALVWKVAGPEREFVIVGYEYQE